LEQQQAKEEYHATEVAALRDQLTSTCEGRQNEGASMSAQTARLAAELEAWQEKMRVAAMEHAEEISRLNGKVLGHTKCSMNAQQLHKQEASQLKKELEAWKEQHSTSTDQRKQAVAAAEAEGKQKVELMTEQHVADIEELKSEQEQLLLKSVGEWSSKLDVEEEKHAETDKNWTSKYQTVVEDGKEQLALKKLQHEEELAEHTKASADRATAHTLAMEECQHKHAGDIAELEGKHAHLSETSDRKMAEAEQEHQRIAAELKQQFAQWKEESSTQNTAVIEAAQQRGAQEVQELQEEVANQTKDSERAVMVAKQAALEEQQRLNADINQLRQSINGVQEKLALADQSVEAQAGEISQLEGVRKRAAKENEGLHRRLKMMEQQCKKLLRSNIDQHGIQEGHDQANVERTSTIEEVLAECKALTRSNQRKETELVELRRKLGEAPSATGGHGSTANADAADSTWRYREEQLEAELKKVDGERRTALMCKTDEINKRRQLEAKCRNLEACVVELRSGNISGEASAAVAATEKENLATKQARGFKGKVSDPAEADSTARPAANKLGRQAAAVNRMNRRAGATESTAVEDDPEGCKQQ
jgi:hypothetical protein